MTTARAEDFEQHRPLLFSIAYRMLGSVADAEDIVQETYLRWLEASETEVHSPRSFLATVTTRLSIDHLRAARVQREEYVGPWLPEPLLTDRGGDAGHLVALNESLSMAFLVLLESLNPVERAVFLLHEVFDYSYPEIADIAGRSEANCRQIAHRARESVASRRQRFQSTREDEERLTDRFIDACTNGDMEGLLNLLSDDVVLWSDGGGKTAAAVNPIHGSQNVAKLLLGLIRKAPAGLAIRPARVNGGPGLIAYVAGQPISVFTFDTDSGRIQTLRIVVNPDKLGAVSAAPDGNTSPLEERS